MYEFRNSLAEFGSGHEPTDRLVRVLRQLRGEWEPLAGHVAKLRQLGYQESMIDLWVTLWSGWLKANPEIAKIQNEVDDGLGYRNVIKTEGGYKVALDVRGRTYRRGGFETAQAAARWADKTRREHDGALHVLNFPTEEEIKTFRKNRPRWRPPVLHPAVIAVAQIKALPALRTDAPGARHGVMRTGNKWGAVHAARWLGTFETVRDAMRAYNSAVLAAPRKSQGKQPMLNFIEEAA